MPRKATGSVYAARGALWGSFTVASGPKGRHTAKLVATPTEEAAEERARLIADAVTRMRSAAVERGIIVTLVNELAAASPTRLVGVLQVVSELCAAKAPSVSESLTFGDVSKAWTTGELAKAYPAHVKTVDHADNIFRLNKHVLPLLRDVPMPAFTLAHAERVLSQPTLPAGSRRHVAQLITRICSLAVYPLRAIAVSPIPRGWLPKPNPRKAFSFLYPDEEAQLLACRDVPLRLRLLFGFLVREGMRRGEAAALEWSDVDLVRGAVRLDENKTDDPRAWRLDPSVARALSWWHERRGDLSAYVFGGDDGSQADVNKLAEQLRGALLQAGVKREALHESTGARQRLRAHDLRATFITLSLASGRSEAWVADRTGHRSSQMINRYKRTARMVEELELGTLAPLDQAIPELVESSTIVDGGSGGQGGKQKPLVRRAGVEPASLAAPEPKAAPVAQVETEGAGFSADSAAGSGPGQGTVDAVDDSATIRRRRRTRVGRAADTAVRAALSGDREALERAVLALAWEHGGLRSASRPRVRVH